MGAFINQNALQVALPQNQQAPNEGPKCIPLVLNFASGPAIQYLDMTNFQQRAFVSMIQTMYVDMRAATDDLVITINSTNQVILAKAGTQGYYAVMVPNPPKFSFANSSGADIIPLFLINAPISGSVWSAT